MFIKFLSYLKELRYKNVTIYKCDYDFYDIPIYLRDLEEV